MVRKPTWAGTAAILSEAFNAWGLPLKALPLSGIAASGCLMQARPRNYVGVQAMEHLFLSLGYFKNSSQTRELQDL